MRSYVYRCLMSLVLVSLIASGQIMAAAQDASTPDQNASVDADATRIALFPKDGDDGDRFEVTVEPGQSAEFTVVYGNFGLEPINLRTFTADVKPVINGGLGILERGSERHEPTTWMEYQDEEFTLASNEIKERVVRVTVPEGALPGQYVNAVVLETVDPVNQDSASLFEQYLRKIVSVYITVPGDVVVAFELGTPEVIVNEGRAGLVVPIANTGNTRVELTGEAKITSSDGTVVFEGSMFLGPIYMGQSTYLQVVFSSVPPQGDYTIDYAFTEKTSQIVQGNEGVAIVVPEDETADDDQPLRFENVTIAPNADPIAFANVSVDVVVNGTAYRATRLTLSVSRDGELVEDFVLAENLALNQGTTTVTQRYLPATSWESGTYTFSLKLESTDGGATNLLLDERDVATLEVP